MNLTTEDWHQLELATEYLPAGSGAWTDEINEVAQPLSVEKLTAVKPEHGLRNCACCGVRSADVHLIGDKHYHIDVDDCIFYGQRDVAKMGIDKMEHDLYLNFGDRVVVGNRR